MAAEAAFRVHHRCREPTTCVARYALEDALAHTAYPEPGRETVRRIITLRFERMAMRLRDSSQATVFLYPAAAKALYHKGLQEISEAIA